jgi:hypothetical protein
MAVQAPYSPSRTGLLGEGTVRDCGAARKARGRAREARSGAAVVCRRHGFIAVSDFPDTVFCMRLSGCCKFRHTWDQC